MNANLQIEHDVKKDSAKEDSAEKDIAEMSRLVERAEGGDRTVLPELRKLLDDYPNLWHHYGDLSLQAAGALIHLTAGKNVLLAESLLRKLAALKEDLAGESPSPLERLLVERVAATWLDVNYHDGIVAQASGVNETRLKMLERRQDAASRRHLAAIKTLATVRKLLTPSHSPVEIATRLGGRSAAGRSCREGIAGTLVPTTN